MSRVPAPTDGVAGAESPVRRGELPLLSVVVPVLNEEERIVAALERLSRWSDCEVVAAVDAGSSDASADRARSVPGVRVVYGRGAGRGPTLARGAREARGRFLLFLHADSRLEEAPVRAALSRLWGRTVAAAFTIRLDSPRPVFRILEAGIHLRSRVLQLPYGDQGLLVSREVFERAGGFRALARCEDVDLVLRLRRLGRIVLVPGPCSSSARRWERDGVFAVTVSNLLLLTRFLVRGAIPDGALGHVLQRSTALEPTRVDPASDAPRADRSAIGG